MLCRIFTQQYQIACISINKYVIIINYTIQRALVHTNLDGVNFGILQTKFWNWQTLLDYFWLTTVYFSVYELESKAFNHDLRL